MASLTGAFVMGLTGCTTNTDPTVPCGAVELSDSSASEGFRAANVLAFTESSGGVTIVRDNCPGETCAGAELKLTTIPANDDGGEHGGLGGAPKRVLLSGTGRYLAWERDGQQLIKRDLECTDGSSCNTAVVGIGNPQRFVGTLRTGDWIVVRDDAGRLNAVNLATDTTAFTLAEDPSLLAVALGHRSIVARRILSGEKEELYLLRVNPTKNHDQYGYSSVGKAIYLGTGKPFSRVLITDGRTPAELGEYDDRDPDTPIDSYVIATSGAGEEANTVVFRVLDGEPVDSFPGAALSSHIPRDEITGLSAVSPDGSHLAYVTNSGALAMRSVRSQGSCLVRAASAGNHTLAGFSLDGNLFFESEDPVTDGEDSARIGVYEPHAARFRALSEGDEGSTLKAVPAQPAILAASLRPWAITARNGFFGAQEAAQVQPLGIEPRSATFLARATPDDSMWLIEAADGGTGFSGATTRVRLKKVRAFDDGANLDFDAQGSDPVFEDDDGTFQVVERSFTSKQVACVTTARPGAWGADCGPNKSGESFVVGGPEEKTN
jgi:hypothetical protein